MEGLDLVVAMDRRNLADLHAIVADADLADPPPLRLLREWDPLGSGDVPDPYHGDRSHGVLTRGS